jgi:hypothetical protein
MTIRHDRDIPTMQKFIMHDDVPAADVEITNLFNFVVRFVVGSLMLN